MSLKWTINDILNPLTALRIMSETPIKGLAHPKNEIVL